MTEKELRRLNRGELLELLIAQMEGNKTLAARLKQADAALERRQIAIETSGTLAEAALRLSGVFEAADQAARQYLESLRAREEEGDHAQ